MKVLFNRKPAADRPTLAEGIREQLRADTLEKIVEHIEAALKERIVWASVPEFGERKFVVRDVRLFEDYSPVKEHSNIYVCFERVQVLLLEGWQTPLLVWTDEETPAEEWSEELPG